MGFIIESLTTDLFHVEGRSESAVIMPADGSKLYVYPKTWSNDHQGSFEVDYSSIPQLRKALDKAEAYAREQGHWVE